MSRSEELSLRRLHYLVVLATELHFGRAASRLHLTQPGLSQQIKVLERELGADVVVRGSSPVRLTSFGADVVREASQLLGLADRACRRIEEARTNRPRSLSIAFTRSASVQTSAEWVRRFTRRFPGVTIRTETAWTAMNLELVASGRCDVAFVRLPVEDTSLATLPIATEELALALAADHRLAGVRHLRAADLVHEPVIGWPADQAPGLWRTIRQQIWGPAGPRVFAEEPDLARILVRVRAGQGIAVADLSRLAELGDDTIAIGRFDRPAPTAQIGLAWNPEVADDLRDQFIASCRRVERPSITTPPAPCT